MRPSERLLQSSAPNLVAAQHGAQGLLYVNTNWHPVEVPITGAMKGVLGGQRWEGTLKLEALGSELLEP